MFVSVQSVSVFVCCVWACKVLWCVCAGECEWIYLPFSLRWSRLFLSIKNGCPPPALCHPPSLPSLFPAASPSLFHRYPLYILSIFFKPSLYITPAFLPHTHTHTHAHTHTHTHTYSPDTFFPACSSWLSPPISFSTTPLSFWTYFIKGLLAGNTHPDLINCC